MDTILTGGGFGRRIVQSESRDLTLVPDVLILQGSQVLSARDDLKDRAYCLTGECSPDVERCLTARVPVASLISRPSLSSPSQFKINAY